MDQVNYRGYARSVGFDPVKAPTEGLRQMAARDDRIIRGMDKNRQEIKQVRDQYGASLERKLNAEQQDRDRNYRWKQQLRENRFKAQQANNATRIKSAATKGDNTVSMLEGLSQFSSTIAETVTEIKKQQADQTRLNGYLELMENGGLSPRQQTNIDNTKALLKQAGEAQDNMVDGLQARNVNPSVVTKLLTGNKDRDIGRVEAHMEIITAEFPAYLQEQYEQQNLHTAAERAAATPQLLETYLKQNQVFGLRYEFMGEYLMKMRGAINSQVESARRSDVANQSSMMRDDATSNFIRTKDGAALTEAFNMISRSYDSDGRTPMGRTAAKNEIYKLLSDTTLFSDADVDRILGEAQTDQGSWRDRFPRDYDNLTAQRTIDEEREHQARDTQERRQGKEAEKGLLDWVKNEWDGSEETLKSIIQKAKEEGIPTDRLQTYLANTNEQQNEDYWNEQFEAAAEDGTLDPEDVNAPGVPFEVRQKWASIAKGLSDARNDTGVSKEEVKSEFSTALKFNLRGESTAREAHFSHVSATNFALKEYYRRLKSYSKNGTMSPSEAAQKARTDVLNMIQNKSGPFTVTGSIDAEGTQAFYNKFTPGNHAGAATGLKAINTAAAAAEFSKDPTVMNRANLVSTGVIANIAQRLEAGGGVSIPPVFHEYAKASKGQYTAEDIVNAQLKKHGYTQQIQPGAVQAVKQSINDPRLQRIFEANRLTQDNLNTVIIGNGNAPATVRVGQAGFQDVIALGQASGFRFPQVMAGMWALESDWGKSHSGKNNVFNIKDFSGGGTLMNGSRWRDYGSVLESAKDFTELMKNTRYAPGLAKARTPREAIQAIAAAGYAGGESDYVDKVLRVMRGKGVNVDQPFAPTSSPTRNQGHMTPTLAHFYITSDIGSPGQSHVDIKQQDNPNTPQNEFRGRFKENELDQYVVVQDPEFGMIPVGELRRRLPGRGDNFDQHVARGSHGIDYPTAMGSKLFLRNGAREVSKTWTRWGKMSIIQLPDGRRFSFLHGK
jgi:hypothetical protein